MSAEHSICILMNPYFFEVGHVFCILDISVSMQSSFQPGFRTKKNMFFPSIIFSRQNNLCNEISKRWIWISRAREKKHPRLQHPLPEISLIYITIRSVRSVQSVLPTFYLFYCSCATNALVISYTTIN